MAINVWTGVTQFVVLSTNQPLQPGVWAHVILIFGESGVKKAAKELETTLLAEIPLEIALRESSDKGMPYMNEPMYEGRAVWKAYMELAKNVDRSFDKGFFRRIFS